MKDKNTIIIIDIVLVVIAIALVIFLIVLNRENDEIVEERSLSFVTENVEINVDDSLMSQYAQNELGFKLKYYKELSRLSETIEENSLYKGAAMYREDGNEGINVLIGNISESITLDEYINANVSAILDSNDLSEEDITIIKDGVKLGGLDAFKVRYKMDNINVYQISTIKEAKEYVITYSAEDTYYDKQKAENMFSTFEFLN